MPQYISPFFTSGSAAARSFHLPVILNTRIWVCSLGKQEMWDVYQQRQAEGDGTRENPGKQESFKVGPHMEDTSCAVHREAKWVQCWFITSESLSLQQYVQFKTSGQLFRWFQPGSAQWRTVHPAGAAPSPQQPPAALSSPQQRLAGEAIKKMDGWPKSKRAI